MKQNLWWATGYNLISVPLAARVIDPTGFALPREAGALLMSASPSPSPDTASNASLLPASGITLNSAREDP